MSRSETGGELSRLIEALRDPAFYPHRPPEVQLVQTHISYVFLAGSEVYKIKKPVRFTFLDFSTLERRRHFCHEEVRLNRRLAPDVYRGVVSVCRGNAGFRLGPEDDPDAVEYAVHMRRLREDRILKQLLESAEVLPEMIDRLVKRLAEFHRSALCDAEVTANGAPAAVFSILQDNFDAVRPFRGRTVSQHDDDAIQQFSRRFLDRHTDLFLRRQSERRIRDGHGDLHSEHICFENGVEIFDCVEFNPKFRRCDAASEIAFLAMDLDFHGRPDLAAHLVQRYAAATGDADLPKLVPFYKCYRAYVRGKVDSLKSDEPEVSEEDRRAASESARAHFTLAYRYTWSYQPCLVVFSGLSGSGKTSVASALQRRTGFLHLNSDIIRKQLAGLPPDAPAPLERERDLYSPAQSARTYETMFARARQGLADGIGVIMDATFMRAVDRQAARSLAQTHGAAFLLVECRCTEDEVRRRLEHRKQGGTGPSDADWQVYRTQKEHFEAFGRTEDDRLELDTARAPDELSIAVEDRLRAAGPPERSRL
jgi:hypothetical protein